ncbi:protein ABHD13-like [Asterias amurensis]|uniref:protein ABHD13-like n=1 Tax=Asterias amurensis TaxID=7602 RepID=UPI003AB62BD5
MHQKETHTFPHHQIRSECGNVPWTRTAMRRPILAGDFDQRGPYMDSMERPNYNQSSIEYQEMQQHASNVESNNAGPANATHRRRPNASPKGQLKSRSPSRLVLLCQLVYSLVSYIIATFWGLCTPWILVLVLCYCMYDSTLVLLLVLAALLGLAYNVQDNLLYFPDEPITSRYYVASAASTGLPHENLYIQTSDRIKIHAVLFKQKEPLFSRAPTVLFFHGNAGNIAHRFFNAHGLYHMTGCNILFLEYRGYGRSEGRVSEEGLYLDAQAGLDYLHKRGDIDKRRIVVFGRSLGGAVAIHVASQSCNKGRIAGVIVENTFTSIPDMGSVLFKMEFLRWIPLFIVKNKYFSINKTKHIRSSSLFISGIEDELVPARMMSDLFRKCGTRHKQLIRFEGGTHNETWRCNGYFTVIREFLTKVTYRETDPITVLPSGAHCVQDINATSSRHPVETV